MLLGKRLRKLLDWSLNIAALLCICFMVWHYASSIFAFHRKPALLQVGAVFPLRDPTSIGSSEHTLVMILSTTCPYCRLSQPFYRQLVAKIPHGMTHIVALFREPPELARAYLSTGGLSGITDVRQAAISSLGATGTPTLLLLDRTGCIRAVWNGILSERQESEVLSATESGIVPQIDDSNVGIDEAAHKKAALLLAEDLHSKSGVTVLDIRGRSDFAYGHIWSAYNIPLDELQTRAQHELDRAKPIRIYCEFRLACNNTHRKGIMTACDAAAFILNKAGFADVATIDADMQDLSCCWDHPKKNAQMAMTPMHASQIRK